MPWLWTIAFVASADAQEASSEAFVPRPVAGHPVFELRIGADRSPLAGGEGPWHPFICAEAAPARWLSFEACGTGAGILHQDPDFPDMAHFRAQVRAASFSLGRTTTDVQLGAGFAEVQRTTDEAGFKFGQAKTADPVEAAGPEAALSIKGRYWMDKGGRTYATADLDAGVAAIPAAPEVLGRGGPVVPFASLTIGMGF